MVFIAPRSVVQRAGMPSVFRRSPSHHTSWQVDTPHSVHSPGAVHRMRALHRTRAVHGVRAAHSPRAVRMKQGLCIAQGLHGIRAVHAVKPKQDDTNLAAGIAGGCIPVGADLPESVHARWRSLLCGTVGSLCGAEHLSSHPCQHHCR